MPNNIDDVAAEQRLTPREANLSRTHGRCLVDDGVHLTRCKLFSFRQRFGRCRTAVHATALTPVRQADLDQPEAQRSERPAPERFADNGIGKVVEPSVQRKAGKATEVTPHAGKIGVLHDLASVPGFNVSPPWLTSLLAPHTEN
jgi:hypothetical protein